MEYKKEFYHLEGLFEQKQYLSTIIKAISVFEIGLRQVFSDYLATISNANDRNQVLSVIEQISGKTSQTVSVEQLGFNELIELEERLEIFFNLRSSDSGQCRRFCIVNLNQLKQHKLRLLQDKSQVKRIDAELFLLVLKLFLTEHRLMAPVFLQNITCHSCGNQVPENRESCPFCGASMEKEAEEVTGLSNTTQFVPRIREKIEEIEKNSLGFWEARFFNNNMMIYIPEGPFKMGTDIESAFPKERPSHRVQLSAYWISKYEVTFDQYDYYCEETRRDKPYDEKWGRGMRPVVNISWFDASEYCEWLSIKTGLSFRLPTEAEWEKAAKGNTQFLYPWGHDVPTDRHANFNYHVGKTSEVGKYPSGISPYGLYDMGGNVREWCLDWYDELYYKSSPAENPSGPVSGDSRIIRGGGWGYDESFLRTTDRNRWIPEDSSNEIGFRIVLEGK